MKLSVDTYKSLTSLVILYQSAAVEILLKYFPTAIYTNLQQALQRVLIHRTQEVKKKWKLRGARFSPTKENSLHQTKISKKTE